MWKKLIAKDIKRFCLTLHYAYTGFKSVWNNQWALRWELLLCLIGVPIALCFGKTVLHTAILISVLILLLIVEFINSAIETVVDRIGLEHNELSGRAKDIGSAAVLLAAINVVVVWLIVFL